MKIDVHFDKRRTVMALCFDFQYDRFVAAAERLVDHPFAFRVKDFIMKFRVTKTSHVANVMIPEVSMSDTYCSHCRLSINVSSTMFPSFFLQLEFTPEGRPYITVKDSTRKSSIANVTIFGKGTGNITINGKDISYFWDIQSREQVSTATPREDYALLLTILIKYFHIWKRNIGGLHDPATNI